MIVCLASEAFVVNSSASDLLIPTNLKLPNRALSCTLNSSHTLSPSTLVTKISILENNFCLQRLEIDFANISAPGCMNLSPGTKLAIEKTIDVSKCFIPEIFTSAMVYSLGTLAFCQSISLGSKDVGLVVSASCACKLNAVMTTMIIETLNLDRSRCIYFVLVLKNRLADT